MARSLLADADGERIDHRWNPDAIRDHISDVVGLEIPETVFSAVSALGAAEMDGMSSRALSWMALPPEVAPAPRWADLREWSGIAAAASHDPRNVPAIMWHALVEGAEGYAAERDADALVVVAGAVAATAERMARHTAEASIVAEIGNAEMADVSVEHDKIDLTTDDDTVQVYTGTSSKSWWEKAWSCTKAEAYSREEKPFDVFVFAYPNDDGTLTLGVRRTENENASPAYSNTPA